MCTYKLLEQYIAYLRIWQRCNWVKVREVWTAWLQLLIQNQVVEPHNKKSNQDKPRIFGLGVNLIWFLSCGCTSWFCIKRFIHIVNTSPAFPQNVHIQVAQTRYCKPTKIASLSEQRYNCCKLQLISFHVAVQCTFYNLVSNSKIKSHSLHCSDFSPEWQPCACTSCSNKILQSYESCISEGA